MGGIFCEGCQIKKNKGKYTIELSYRRWITCNITAAGAVIVINKKNVSESDFALKLVDVTSYANEDSIK